MVSDNRSNGNGISESDQETATFGASDFTVDLVILESQCFNTAGALVTVEPELTIESPVTPSSNQQFTVVYEIHGGESVETQRLELTGTRYSYSEHVVSTASCDYDLSARVAQVIER